MLKERGFLINDLSSHKSQRTRQLPLKLKFKLKLTRGALHFDFNFVSGHIQV